jgi:SAM-dependent methyltransferase
VRSFARARAQPNPRAPRPRAGGNTSTRRNARFPPPLHPPPLHLSRADQRYANPLLRELITANVPRAATVLVPGCGSSTLSTDMVDDGFTGGIANIDISRTVIDDLADRLKNVKGLSCAWDGGVSGRARRRAPERLPALRRLRLSQCAPAPTARARPPSLPAHPPPAVLVMNCCALNFPDASFDAVIDKGTLDSILCSEASTANSGRYTHEVARVLKPGGVFIIVSQGAPEIRMSYLEGDYGWSTSISTIPKPSISTAGLPEASSSDPSAVHYVYVCRKGE